MRRFGHSPNSIATVDRRLQLPKRLAAALETLFVLFLIMGATLWDDIVAAGEPLTQSSRIGLVMSVISCITLFALSRQKWPLLLCTLLFALIRIPWFGSIHPENLSFLVDCSAVSISLSAVIFRAEIADAIGRAGSMRSGRHSGSRIDH